MEFEQIGKYKIQAEIGQGAMGVVYKAHDPILNRDVAIKTISAALGSDDDLRKRFHREAQAAARLNHPNIITVFDFGEEHGKIYMAMELLEGTDLKDVMAAGTLVTLDDKLAVMEQILDGLAFAHAKEVVHRDLKPGNIHIQPNGQIKIMDFGLARLGSSEMTQAGVVMGTPNYMSPEQVLGEKVDVRSDVFAMGAVFYELVTSHKPFEAESMHGVLFQVVHKEPQQIRKWAPDLPPVLVQIVEKCLIKDKNKRFQNAGELREAVAAARQALLQGRISEATLDMESGNVFFEAEEFEGGQEGDEPAPQARGARSWPPNKPEGQWVEGTVALDQAPLEEVLDHPAPVASANKSHPTLSGRNRTQVNRQQTQRGLPVQAPQASRAPIYIGGGLVLVAAIAGGLLWMKSRQPVIVDKKMTGVVQLLIETRNELAQKNLEDKDYKKAIETVESTVSMAKEEGAPEGHKLLVQARKILTEARTKFTAIESTATEAEDAFRGGNGELAAQKLGQLIELDPKHPVATELSPKLNQFFKKQANDAREMMALAKDQAEKVSNSATGEYRAEGREDMGKANAALTDAEGALKKQAFAQATRQFLEARDAYDRSRRAIETKISDAAQKDQELRKQLKVPAEESRKTMAAARTLAEQVGAQSNAAGAEEFKVGVAEAKTAEAAMATNDYLVAKKAFDDSRIAFDRARQAALRPPPTVPTAPPPVTQPPVTQPPQTQPPVTQAPGTLPPVTQPPVTLPTKIPVGRLQANAANTTQLSSGKLKGFEDATNPDFVGEMELEVSPAQIAIGEAFAVKVTLNNTGKKAMKLKDMVGTTRVNAAPGPALTATLKVRDIAIGQKVVVGEITGTWAEGVNTWVMEAKVTGDKGDSAANKVVFRKNP